MNVIQTPLSGLLIIEPKIFSDERGFFFEGYEQRRYSELGIPHFVQDNLSHSKKNVLRGLHYQYSQTQGKLVYVIRGHVWDVCIDIRKSSPTFGLWFGIELSEDNHKQIYIPPGFAHGFCVLSDEADFHYKCTDFYLPNAERGIIWNDPELNITWPISNPILSSKDKVNSLFEDIKNEKIIA